ncbi:MAG: thioredoxin [Gammaproteobacteria bacterium]|nr:thioredoxin [Gammaproteobacteria bacterium]MCW8909858.1 thioredoxin [Gammaproteobacteria bacterium]MCW9006059.1 thioredoxin [Gammaproteobacteria bacterium]MCW9056281.1 thioredoxin [Gammaproteobacteria bacterium]
MATVDLNEQNLEETVNGNDIVIIDFWAPWCGPCKSFGPIYEEVSEKHPDIVFGKINTEDEQAIAAHFQIRSIPTLMVFREQIIIFAEAGMLPANALEQMIEQVKTLDMDKVKADIEAGMKEAEAKAAEDNA